jgi:hypothetical protein
LPRSVATAERARTRWRPFAAHADRSLEEWGQLDEDRNWTTECVEQEKVLGEEPGRVEVFCPTCVAAAEPRDWDVRAGGTTEDKFGQSLFFACNACGTEYVVV